jgi:enamine deaminase RidA (YjgF/YER057c/UK114 family)
LQSLLLENGSSLDNALQVTIYVRDMANFGELNRAYASFVSSSSPPTRYIIVFSTIAETFTIIIFCIFVESLSLQNFLMAL